MVEITEMTVCSSDASMWLYNTALSHIPSCIPTVPACYSFSFKKGNVLNK